jgi:hypothetical protein
MSLMPSPTRTFHPGAHYMVTYRMRRVLAVYTGNGVWTVAGAYAQAEDITDISPQIEPPKVHDVQWSVE